MGYHRKREREDAVLYEKGGSKPDRYRNVETTGERCCHMS